MLCTQVEREQRQEWSQLQGLEHDDDDQTDVASADTCTDAEAELIKQGMMYAEHIIVTHCTDYSTPALNRLSLYV
jgi:hypothetical protein